MTNNEKDLILDLFKDYIILNKKHFKNTHKTVLQMVINKIPNDQLFVTLNALETSLEEYKTRAKKNGHNRTVLYN